MPDKEKVINLIPIERFDKRIYVIHVKELILFPDN